MFSLLDQYVALHADPAVFSGRSLRPHATAIARLVRGTQSKTLLDYGCGKGEQYLHDQVHRFWGGIEPALYDPAVPQFAARPVGRFDGVICTDVLEHVPEADLDDMLRDVLAFAQRFAFFSIATRAAKRRLPDGRNAHVTVRPRDWWQQRIAPLHPRRVELRLVFVE